jgi:hypothetical protein
LKEVSQEKPTFLASFDELLKNETFFVFFPKTLRLLITKSINYSINFRWRKSGTERCLKKIELMKHLRRNKYFSDFFEIVHPREQLFI